MLLYLFQFGIIFHNFIIPCDGFSPVNTFLQRHTLAGTILKREVQTSSSSSATTAGGGGGVEGSGCRDGSTPSKPDRSKSEMSKGRRSAGNAGFSSACLCCCCLDGGGGGGGGAAVDEDAAPDWVTTVLGKWSTPLPCNSGKKMEKNNDAYKDQYLDCYLLLVAKGG